MRFPMNRYTKKVLGNYQMPDGPEGCWIWQGKVGRDGYGAIRGEKYGTVMAHRLYYMWYVGPIPTNMEVDHLCRNRRCVNPKHLEPVTKAENHRRGLNCRLVPAYVTEIRQKRARTGQSYMSLGREYGISDTQVSRICRRLDWRDVP